jgi:hypothetical protein
MTKRTVLFSVFLFSLTIAVFAQGSKYLKVAKNGTGNILFSNTQINRDQEAKSTFKTVFSNADAIYARAYFPGKFVKLEGEAVGFIDLWIDGKHAKRIKFSNDDVAAGNDQMQIYVHNTDPSADFSDDVWDYLSAGDHNVKIVVGRTEFMKAAATLEEQGNDLVVKEDDVYKPVYISESNFTFTKK